MERGQAEVLRVAAQENESWWRAWLDPGLQLVTIVVGFGIVVYQLHRQHQNDLRLQSENQRNEFRLKLHDRLSTAVEAASKELTPLGAWGGGVVTELKLRQVTLDHGIQPGLTHHRSPQLARTHSRASDATVHVMSILEQNEVGLPDFGILKQALGVQLSRVREAFNTLSSEVEIYLSSDLTTEQAQALGGLSALGPVKTPGTTELERLQQLASALHCEEATLQSYLMDLSVEAQNELLSDFFGRKANHREPTDPEFRVVSRDPEGREELQAFLDERRPAKYRNEEK